MKVGIGSCHGTFGEIVQGIVNGTPFLIPLPLNQYSHATFNGDEQSNEILVNQRKTKARKACELLLHRFHIRSGGTLTLRSNLPTGKGMASSTADIIAALRATAMFFSLPINEEIISEIAVTIEPTDGIMYDFVVAYDYKNGRVIEKLGGLPEMVLIGIDTGGTVDTQLFNLGEKAYKSEELVALNHAYTLVKSGIEDQRTSVIFEAATISSLVNQRILPKPYFETFQETAQAYEGGLVIAHSGTMMGILLDPFISKGALKQIATEIKRETGQSPLLRRVGQVLNHI